LELPWNLALVIWNFERETRFTPSLRARREYCRPDLPLRPRLRLTRSEITIHEFGRQRHHDQSKNPTHTTGSKLALRWVVLKFKLDAIHRSDNANRQCIAGRYRWMFAFFSNRLGCLGSIVVSVIGTLILLAILRGCH